MHQLFTMASDSGPVHVLLGEDIDIKYLDPVGVVYTTYWLGDKRSGTIGVLGASRLRYPEVIPLVRYLGNTISEMAQGW